jgi:rhamnulokinase
MAMVSSTGKEVAGISVDS